MSQKRILCRDKVFLVLCHDTVFCVATWSSDLAHDPALVRVTGMLVHVACACDRAGQLGVSSLCHDRAFDVATRPSDRLGDLGRKKGFLSRDKVL